MRWCLFVLTFFFPRNSIHDQQLRFLNSWPVAITLHDTSSSAILAMPPLWNGISEAVTQLYPVLTFFVWNQPSVLLNIFPLMGILLQSLFTLASLIIAIPQLIMVFFKVSNLCCIGWYDALTVPPMFWNMILMLLYLSLPLSWWNQSRQQSLLGFVSLMFGITLWRCLKGCR